MEELIVHIKEVLQSGDLVTYVRATAILVFGLIFAKLAGRSVDRTLRKYLPPQKGFLAGRAVYYTIAILVIITVLRQFGFEFFEPGG